VRNSSSGQEESTVLIINFAQISRERTYDVGLHGPVKLLSSDIGDASLVVLLVSPIIGGTERDDVP